MTVSRHTEDSTSMNTNINTIGWQILVQSLIRYGAFVVMLWLALTFADGWIAAYLAAH